MILWTPEQESAEVARLAALAAQLGCKPSEVTPARLQIEADRLGCQWFEVEAVLKGKP